MKPRSLFRSTLRPPRRWNGENQAHIEERRSFEVGDRMRAVGLSLADIRDIDISGSSLVYDPTATMSLRLCSWTNLPVITCPGAHIKFSFTDKWTD